MQKSNLSRFAREYAWITLGALLYAVGFDWFYAPNAVGFGGVTGLGQVVHALLPAVPIGLFVLAVNIPLFLLGWKLIGGGLLASSLYAMTVSSLAVDALNLFFVFQPMDRMLACVCGGATVGYARGIVFAQGATTGGTDLTARLLRLKFPWVSMGKLLLFLDLGVIALVALAFGSVTTALYGAVAQVVSAYLTDAVLYGLDRAKAAYIISKKPLEIRQAIDRELDRGATVLHGEGGYSGEPMEVLLCAFKQKQIVTLKRIVKELDPGAFLIVFDAHEVLGLGFRNNEV